MWIHSLARSIRHSAHLSTHRPSQALQCFAEHSLRITPQRPSASVSDRLLSTQTSHKGRKLWYHARGAADFVARLSEEEKMELIAELKKNETEDKVTTSPPLLTSAEIRYVLLFSAVPFIGFGALDNTFMLIAGEYIDITFGVMLGITTMAAAAFGNMVSDVLGIMTAGVVEQTASKLGLKTPQLSLEQMSLRSYRWTANLGRCIGVIIGCIIGMWPLMYAKKKKEPCSNSEASSLQ